MAEQELTTPIWSRSAWAQPRSRSLMLSRTTPAEAHLKGPIAQALMAHAPNLLAAPPVIGRWTC